MKADPRDTLIRDMLDTIEGLGYVQSARIDARVWAMIYKRRIAKLYDHSSTHHINRRTGRRA